MNDVSYTRFAYLDTNIYSYLVKDESLQQPFANFLRQKYLCLAFGEGHLYELSKDDRLHEPLVDLLLLMPSAIIKTKSDIRDEEVKAHPNYRSDTLLLDTRIDRQALMNALSEHATPEARRSQIDTAAQMNPIFNARKENFPPSKSGKYTKEQALEFADLMVIQTLGQDYYNFLSSFKGNLDALRTDVFKTMMLHALVFYQKFCLQGREPNKREDFGDLWHLPAIPYCVVAIMEKDQCQILTQVKQHHDILSSTDLKNIDFLRGL